MWGVGQLSDEELYLLPVSSFFLSISIIEGNAGLLYQ